VCITRKGDSALRLLTNRDWENHLFALSVFARDNSFGAKTDNSIDTGLGKLLGYYPNIQHEMLHTDAAQQRPGNLPSAPQASKKPLRAQNQANGFTTSQRRQSRPGDTTAAERPAGTMDTTHISLIHDGPPSPPPWNSTPHGTMSTLQRTAPTTTGRAQHERKAQPARHHPLEEGNEQAGSNSLQLGGESTPHVVLAQCTFHPMKPIIKAKSSTQHMLTPARDPSFGDGHEQAKHVMGQTPTKNKQKNSDDRKMLQRHAQAPTPLQLSQDHGENAMIRPQRLARNVPHQSLEEGHGQAGSRSQQLRRESTPHATLGPDMLQSTQSITNAKLRLLHRSVPGNVPAKRGMGQQKLGQKMGNLPKKILLTARASR